MAENGTVGMVSGTQVTLQSVGPHGFKVRLMDVPDEQARVKTKEGVADIVNEGVIEAANVMLEATGNIGSLAINNSGTIRATGVRANADGSVSLVGGEGDVRNSGVIAALRKNLEGRETGGEIQVAGRNITTESSSRITAAGAAGGGNIRMRATDTTLISGRVEATGYANDSKGGRVELLGKNVGLRSGEVNADGGAKGGTVLAGGDYLGLNPEVPNAKATVITPDARISANATVCSPTFTLVGCRGGAGWDGVAAGLDGTAAGRSSSNTSTGPCGPSRISSPSSRRRHCCTRWPSR